MILTNKQLFKTCLELECEGKTEKNNIQDWIYFNPVFFSQYFRI